MATMGSAWNGQDQDGLHIGTDEHFQQFLDMNAMGNLADNIQFDFADFQNQSPDPMASTSNTFVDTPMTGAHNASGLLSQSSTGPGPLSMPAHSPTDAISEIDAQIQYLQQQRMQQQQRQIEEQNVAFFARHNHMVPPTPQSLELQAGNQFFASPDQHSQHNQHSQHAQHQNQQQTRQQAVYERYQHFKEQQDLSFTPLVSPAVTPLETQFSIDTQFTMPGAYFSPLTSPALHAQNDASAVFFDPRLMTSSASPLDMDMEMLPTAAPVSTAAPTSFTAAAFGGDVAKKTRKTNASKPRKANVRQSPITKPMRKKSTTTPVINAQVLDQLAESLEHGALSSPVILQQQQQFPTLHQSHHLGSTAAASTGGPTSSSTDTTDSENGSVSPETLTDMPPPPVPKSRSARPSPYLHAQSHTATSHTMRTATSAPHSVINAGAGIGSSSLPGGFPSPATPASLMKLASPKLKSHKPSPLVAASSSGSSGSSSNSSSNSASVASEHIENFELPESLSMDFQKPQLPTSTVEASSSEAITATTTASPMLDPISASRTPGGGFLHHHMPSNHGSSTAATTGSATQSPQILPGGSGTPIMAAQSQSNRKTPQMLPRGGAAGAANKKRHPSISSSSSVQGLSPALRPRISPSIKPLLPGGGGGNGGLGGSAVEDQATKTARLLLATKSNYQNILEGNTVPGVSYPSELSTNLTSKRTSHKLAEQGRRNRINSALQEMATLLPRPKEDDSKESKEAKEAREVKEAKEAKDGKDSTPNSKASTVEMAIEYIKQLKKEVADATKRAEAAEAKLRLRQAAAEGDEVDEADKAAMAGESAEGMVE